MKPYNKTNISYAKELRKEMTEYEKKLWFTFLRTYPVRFQRQKSIGNYIADFYCAKAKLVIELDGSGHYEKAQQKYDQERTRYFESIGLKELRFTNLEIARNYKGVCELIHITVEKQRGKETRF